MLLVGMVLGLGGAGSARAEKAPNAPEQTTSQTQSDSDQTTNQPDQDTSDSDQAPGQGKKTPVFVQNVDAWFGAYLVKPVFLVLFFNVAEPYFLLTEGTLQEGQKRPVELPFIVVWLFVGACFFTVRMGFINIRGFWHAIRLTRGDYDRPTSKGEVSHFQALSSALSATVGLGNIAGVAIAVGTGGPGATFWMIMAGLLGMTTKFTECTLGQKYRRVDADGRVSGGPMHYLKDGLQSVGLGGLGLVLAPLFSLFCIAASFGGGCAFQVSQSMQVAQQQLREAGTDFLFDAPWVYGGLMAILVGLVIIGGIRRIAATAARVVPLMCVIYVVCCLAILAMNLTAIGPAFRAIFVEAFSPQAAFGGLIGVLILGIRRAAFSNEAGVGSAAIAHSAAKTDEPVSEGIVALLEPFIDTVVVCTMTALVIVITGVYQAPEYQGLVASDGAALTAAAFRQSVWWFPYILLAAVVLFAYSTMISWSYYGERCWSQLFGTQFGIVYKILFLVFVMLGSIVTAQNILDFSDLMILAMSFPNIIGLYILNNQVRADLDSYWRRLNSGEIAPYQAPSPSGQSAGGSDPGR